MTNLKQLLDDLNLDEKEDLEIYLLEWSYFKVGDYRVIISICKDGHTLFLVNGQLEVDNIPANTGCRILLVTIREWKKLNKKLVSGTELFCYPVKSDGMFSKRVEMFLKAGFSKPDKDDKMVYITA